MLSLRTLGVELLLALWCHAAVVTEHGYPVLWQKAAGELPGGEAQLDPWDYLQRMSMYRLMINATGPYMSSMGPGERESPLWSLPMQLGWKLKSGRLQDPSPGSSSSCGVESVEPVCISPQSWYGCINYYVSVLPFLAAVQSGVVGQHQLQLSILPPQELGEEYCTSHAHCSARHPDAISKWETFFQSLKHISESDDSDFDKKDKILGLMWSAEEESLQTASVACSDRMKLYSSSEVRFGKSWFSSASYVAAAHFHSSIDRTEKFMTPLPSRVLQESDSPPHILDLSAEENHTLYIFGWMNSINQLLGGTLVTLWRSAMCSPQARVKGQALLQDLILDPTFPASSLMSILTEMATTC